MSITRPCVRPGEFAPAYLGRIRHLNGWRDIPETVAKLQDWWRSTTAAKTSGSIVELLASAAELDLGTFLRDHTAMPLRIHPGQQRRRRVHLPTPAELAVSGMRGFRQGAYFCRECVNEDLVRIGTPYWRREHQVRGLYWCRQHATPLQFTSDRKSFWSSPSKAIPDGEAASSDWISKLQACATTTRFLQISLELLSGTQVRVSGVVSREFRRLYKSVAPSLGLRRGRPKEDRVLRESYYNLPDLLRHRFDPAWLNATVPAMRRSKSGTSLDPILDALTSGSPSAVLYAATVAALTDVNVWEWHGKEPTSEALLEWFGIDF